MDIENEMGIYTVQSDYANGTGSYGYMFTKYAEVLNQYKQIFSQYEPFKAEGLADSYSSESRIVYDKWITDLALFVVIIIVHILIPGRIGWSLLSFLVGVVKFIRDEETCWMWLSIVVVPYAFVSFLFRMNDLRWMWPIFFIPLGIHAFIQLKRQDKEKSNIAVAHEMNKKKVIKQKEIEEELKKIRKQLRDIVPSLRNEYREYINKMISEEKSKDVLERKYGILPKKFWWEISPSELYADQIEMEYAFSQLLVTQEVRAIVRKEGKEFKNAGEEYSPMYAESLTISQLKEIYNGNRKLLRRNGGIILDIVSCVRYSSFEKKIEEHDVYKKNFLERAIETYEWNEVRNNIQQSYVNGRISDVDYYDLCSEYDWADSGVRDSINRKTTETYEIEKMKNYEHYVWTGQVLLIPDLEEKEGSYILIDYRCRPEYIYENLRTIMQCHITKMWNDVVGGNTFFIAKMQQIFLLRN